MIWVALQVLTPSLSAMSAGQLMCTDGRIPGSTVVASGRASPWRAGSGSCGSSLGALHLLLRLDRRWCVVHDRRGHHLAQPIRRVLPPVGGGCDCAGSLRAE